MVDNPRQPIKFEGIPEANIRKSSRGLWIANGLLLAALLAIAWTTQTYYYHFFRGPIVADDAMLLALAEEPGNGNLLGYVELRDRKLIPTGFTQQSTKGGKVYSSIPYFSIPVGDRIMLVQAEKDAQGRKNLVGPISRMPEKTEAEVIGALVEKNPELKGRFLPITINGAAAFNVIGYIGLGLLGPIALLCLFNLGRAFSRTFNSGA